MAKYRQIYTEFWSDSFVFELTSQEKFFYLYLLTNTKSTQSGIYEISPKFIAIETGYDIVVVDQLLKKFCDYKKILFCETTNEIMLLNWIKYNVPNNNNAVIGIQKQLLRIKNKVFLKILFEKCKDAKLDVEKIFKDIFVDEHIESPYFPNNQRPKNIVSIMKPLDSYLVGATKPLLSNRIRSKEEGVKNKEQGIKSKEQRVITKEEAVITKEKVIFKEEVMTQDKVITKVENTSAASEGLITIIKIFEENVHAITPLVYKKILEFTKQVSDKVIIMAITEAVNYNAKTIKYISKVLNSWISKGIKTAEQVIAYQRQWTSNSSSNNNNSATNYVKSSNFCDYEQRSYDFDILEKQLLGIA
ncbi:MAG TPA: DnaD domain protein [Clostridium sp.]|uniref:DnaD domain-containing protein n=1 Tax=Clostridium sp. TaxID=1506 RepID=UPI002F9484DE